MAIIITLGKQIDKKGSEVVVKSASSIQDTAVIPFFMKNFSSLIEKGLAHSVSPPVTIQTRAFYAEIDNKIVGHIVYNILDDVFKTAWIVFSCVEEEYRGRGIYNIMHDYFEKSVKAAGSKKIASYVHVNNTARQASCESVGMRPFYYKMEKNI